MVFGILNPVLVFITNKASMLLNISQGQAFSEKSGIEKLFKWLCWEVLVYGQWVYEIWTMN